MKGKIAEVRGLNEGEDAISPATFPDWTSIAQIRDFADEIKQRTGGIPVGYKLSAQKIEKDIDAALEVGVDYIILDGRGGGTGAAPLIFRDNISVPTIPALARARRHLDASGAKGISLIITGGLRTPEDFAKALALGADWMSRHAGLQFECLPRWHRNTERGFARAPAGSGGSRTPGALLLSKYRTDDRVSESLRS